MYVEITEKHLKAAVKAGTITSPTRGPIARALREAGFKDAGVGNDSWEVYLENCPVKLTLDARSFSEMCFRYGRANSVNHFVRAARRADMRSMLPFKIRVPKL